MKRLGRPSPRTRIWQQPDWPRFRWDAAATAAPTRAGDGLVQVLLDATERHDRPLDFERLCRRFIDWGD